MDGIPFGGPSMPSRLRLRHIALVVTIGSVLLFQNCAETPQDPTSYSTQSSYQQRLPFAYKERVDTIAYMSCSEIKDPVDPRAYFSYRVGAYNTDGSSGLGITKPFYDATQYYKTEKRAQALSGSDLNASTLMTLSIRLRSNLQSLWAQGDVGSGSEVDSFLPLLDSAEVAGPFAGLKPNEKMLNYFPGKGSKRLIEASLRFFEFENVSKLTRSNLEGIGNPAYLVVGYSSTADESDSGLRSPDTDGSHAYGTGYAVTFSLPNTYSAGERRVISPYNGVREIDLQTGQEVASTWQCPASYQMMVIRPEDQIAKKVICNPTVDRFSSPDQQMALNVLRRVLRVEDWYIDMDNRCIMPKRTGDYCYGSLQGRNVQYGQASCTNAGATACPHFLSICIRR